MRKICEQDENYQTMIFVVYTKCHVYPSNCLKRRPVLFVSRTAYKDEALLRTLSVLCGGEYCSAVLTTYVQSGGSRR
jgi:hypothetical protein